MHDTRTAAATAFWVGHATHPDWRTALALAAAQIDGQRAAAPAGAPMSPSPPPAPQPALGIVYFSDHYAAQAGALVAALRARWPGVAWAGCAAVGVAAGGVEYMDEPALALMLSSLPVDDFELFSGARKLRRTRPFSALVHADPATPDLADLIAEMSARTESGYLFGGLVSSRAGGQHVAAGPLHLLLPTSPDAGRLTTDATAEATANATTDTTTAGSADEPDTADGVLSGGLSGVAFVQRVALVSRVTQGCQPVGPTRRITACDRNVITELDGQPALNCLLADLGLANLSDTRGAVSRLRGTLVGLTDAAGTALSIPGKVSGQFGTDTRVRHLVGLDPGRQAVAVAEIVQPGMRAAFCQRDVQAARRDLVRVCSEIRDEVESPSLPGMPADQPLTAAPQGAGADGADGAHGTASPGSPVNAEEPRSPAHTSPAPTAAAPRILGAIYVSCTGRGGAHFGGPSAEMQTVRHALGDVPLIGFFAAGEIARHHLYGYTGVLTVFTAAP